MNETICLCGGGALGHTLSGYLASQGVTVNVLTPHAALWHKEITLTLPCRAEEGTAAAGTSTGTGTGTGTRTVSARLGTVSALPQDVIPQSRQVWLTVPGYLVAPILQQVAPFLSPGTVVGSVFASSGFFFIARGLMATGALPPATPLFGFRRVPFISRVVSYGASARITGFKDALHIGTYGFEKRQGAVRNEALANRTAYADREALAQQFSQWLHTPVYVLDHYLQAALSNSNPVLHPSRLYALFKDYRPGKIYPRPVRFYEEWDNESSQVLLACDAEFQSLCAHLGQHIPSLLTHYESHDAASLTQKIRSIASFKGMSAPLKPVEGTPVGYVPDFENRYFTEDFPYGLLILQNLAARLGVPTPTMDTLVNWAAPYIDMRPNPLLLKGIELERVALS